MKALLCPLFFVQSFCKHCVRLHYKENPQHWIWRHELARLPPLGMFEPKTGFSPDLPVFLMFDEFIADEQAMAVLREEKHRPWLGPWPEVIGCLNAEGALEIVDLQTIVRSAGTLRSTLTRRDMRNPASWSMAMDFHDSLFSAAQTAFADLPEESAALSWSFDPHRVASLPGGDHEAHSMSVVLREDLRDQVHAELLPEALAHLKMQLAEVNAGIAASLTLEAAPMFWAPYGHYLKAKAATSETIEEGVSSASAARLFFEVAFPRFKPDTVADLSRLRKDRRLGSLRSEIERAYRSGQSIDKDYPQAILQETLHMQRRVGKLRKITTWLSAAVGLVPLPGVGLAATAAGEALGAQAESRIQRRLDWLYLISDGVGNS